MKIVAVLLAALIALGNPPGAMAAETTNLYANAGYETWNGGRCTGWSGKSGAWETALSESTAVKHAGEKALQMLPTEGESVYVYQAADVLPGTEYAVSFWFYGMAEKENTGNVEIAFEYRKADGKTSAGPTVRVKPVLSGNGIWQRLSADTETPMECEILRAVIYVYDPGGGYVDDARLIQTGEPKYGEASTDRIYYYKEEIRAGSEGEAVVTLNPYFAPEDFTASIVWQDAESERTPLSTEGKAVLPYPLEGLTELKKAYTVEARIYAADAPEGTAPLWTEEKTVYAYNRPLALDEAGNYRRMRFDTTGNPVKDGEAYVLENEIFQPTLAYHVSQPKAGTADGDNMYLQAQKAGVNVVQLSHYYADAERIEKALDVCADYGLMALVCLYRSNVAAGNETELIKNARGEYTTNAANTKAVVEIAKNHPATFAYAVKDEPFSHMTPTMYVDLENAYKIIRDIDDVHPVYIVDTADVETLPKYTDICAIDPYPESPEESGTDAAYHTARAVEAAKGQKPVYVILQAFCYGDTDGDGVHDYFPEWTEIRHMWYQALAAGAKAVGYYAFDDPMGETGDKETTINETPVWGGMTEFAEAEMEKSYAFFRESALLAQYGSEAENGAAWSVQLRKKDGETFALVLSKSSMAQEAAAARLFTGKIAEVYLGDGESVADMEGDTWTLTLPGSCADIYRLQTADVSISQNGHVVSDARRGESVRAEAMLEGETDEKISLIWAVYGGKDGKKELLDFTVLAEGTGRLEFSEILLLPETAGASEVKLLILSGGFPGADFRAAGIKIE